MIMDIRRTPDVRKIGMVRIKVGKDVPFGGKRNRLMYQQQGEEEAMEMYFGKDDEY
jgi:hypothetical protein